MKHIELAHFWWQTIVGPEDFVIDMTCGNGHDTLFLTSLGPKRVVALDIQPIAIEKAKKLAPLAEFQLKSHSEVPDELEDETVKLAVYNLGWLPGSDKSCTTLVSTTLESVKKLLPKVVEGGMISITCYPGHAEGEREEKALLEAIKELNPYEWSVCYHQWPNRKKGPSLILIQRLRDST